MKRFSTILIICLAAFLPLTSGCALLLALPDSEGSQNQELSEEEQARLEKLGGQQLVDDAKYFNSLSVDRRTPRDDPKRHAAQCFSSYLEGRGYLMVGLEEFREFVDESTFDPERPREVNGNDKLQLAEGRFDSAIEWCEQASKTEFERQDLLQRYTEKSEEYGAEATGHQNLFIATAYLEYLSDADSRSDLRSRYNRLEDSEAIEKASENLDDDNEDLAVVTARYEHFIEHWGDWLADYNAYLERDDVKKLLEEKNRQIDQKRFAREHLLNTSNHESGKEQIELADEIIEDMNAELKEIADEDDIGARFERLHDEYDPKAALD